MIIVCEDLALNTENIVSIHNSLDGVPTIIASVKHDPFSDIVLFEDEDTLLVTRIYEALVNDWCLGSRFFDVKTAEKRILETLKTKENE